MSYFRDSFRILTHINVKRLWNLYLLKVSFLFSKLTKRSLHMGMPNSLSIEPTTACNLGCPECPSGLKKFTRPTGKLDLELHQRILAQVKSTVFYINYYGLYYRLKHLKNTSKTLHKYPHTSSKPSPKYLRISSKM